MTVLLINEGVKVGVVVVWSSQEEQRFRRRAVLELGLAVVPKSHICNATSYPCIRCLFAGRSLWLSFQHSIDLTMIYIDILNLEQG